MIIGSSCGMSAALTTPTAPVPVLTRYGVTAAPSMRPWRYDGANPDGWYNPLAMSTSTVGRLNCAADFALLASMCTRPSLTTVRFEIPWRLVEKTSQGTYDWVHLDNVVNTAMSYGFSLQAIVVFTPSWSGAFNAVPTTAQLNSFLTAVVNRYKAWGTRGQASVDTFNRTTSNSWGSADFGGPWSTAITTPAASVFNATPGVATLTVDPTTIYNFLPRVAVQDVDLVAKITPPAASTSFVDGGILVRYNKATTDCYQLSAYQATTNNGGNLTVQLKRKPANTTINADFNTTVPGGLPYWLRLQAQGTSPTTLRWKCWQDGTTEPTTWMGTGVDNTTNMQSAGGLGVEGYINSGTAFVNFNVFQAYDLAQPWTPYGVRVWEVWNEPNDGSSHYFTGSATQYSTLLNSAYPVIKAADHYAQVICAGVATAWTTWISGMTAGTPFDYMAFHDYPGAAGTVNTDYNSANSQCQTSFPGSKPLIIDEYGVQGSGDNSSWLTTVFANGAQNAQPASSKFYEPRDDYVCDCGNTGIDPETTLTVGPLSTGAATTSLTVGGISNALASATWIGLIWMAGDNTVKFQSTQLTGAYTSGATTMTVSFTATFAFPVGTQVVVLPDSTRAPQLYGLTQRDGTPKGQSKSTFLRLADSS